MVSKGEIKRIVEYFEEEGAKDYSEALRLDQQRRHKKEASSYFLSARVWRNAADKVESLITIRNYPREIKTVEELEAERLKTKPKTITV